MGNIARPPCDEAERPTATSGRWILAATILGSSMAFIDGTVVNVALPALQSALGATIAQVQWVVESYALFLAALLLIGGSLGDMYGRRKIFVAGVALFSVASTWCGLAPNIQQLIVARGLQGIGGALLVPGSLALISANFSPRGARPRDRDVVWLHVDHRRDRSCAGRMVHAARFVEMGVFYQCSAGPGGGVAGSMESPGEHGRPTKISGSIGWAACWQLSASAELSLHLSNRCRSRA